MQRVYLCVDRWDRRASHLHVARQLQSPPIAFRTPLPAQLVPRPPQVEVAQSLDFEGDCRLITGTEVWRWQVSPPEILQ